VSRAWRFAAPAAAIVVLAAGCGSSSTSTTTVAHTAPSGNSTVDRGHRLYEVDGCAGCHSLTGERMTGPSWKGLAGSTVQLADGRTIAASNTYLTDHIVNPNAWTVRGYPGEVMAAAIEGLDLSQHPKDVAALVAFIDSVRG